MKKDEITGLDKEKTLKTGNIMCNPILTVFAPHNCIVKPCLCLSVPVCIIKCLFDYPVVSGTALVFGVIFLAIDTPTVDTPTIGLFWLCGWQPSNG